MSKTADALRLSAARTPIAIGQMSVEDLMAGLSDEQKTALAASLVPAKGNASSVAAAATSATTSAAGSRADDSAPADPDPDDPNEMDPDEKAKNKKAKSESSASDQHAVGFAAATERAVAVMTSEHFEGRAAHAVKLLGNAKLSAEEITGMLSDMPDGSGEKMLASIRDGNPQLGTGGGNANDSTKPGASASADNGWSKAHARAQKLFGGRAKK